MREQDIIFNLSKIRTLANKFIVEKMETLGVNGLAPSHGDILFVLFDVEQMTMKDLAHAIGKDKSTLTVLVGKLLKLGYILKNQDTKDSRITYLSLTKEGRELKPMFLEISNSLFYTVYQNISETDKVTLLSALDTMEQNLKMNNVE